MLRVTSIISGLALLALGVLLTVPPAAAQQTIALRVLAEQRVDELAQEPLCWTVSRRITPPGGQRPGGDAYHAHALFLGYQVEGNLRLEYAGGPTLTQQLGTGTFIGNNNWHKHIVVGTSPTTELNFVLRCESPIAAPGVTRLATTSPLSGIRPGPAVPYVVRLIEGTGGPGAQLPVHSHAGPETVYVWEGAVAISTAAGVTQYKAGDLFVIPPGTPHQPTVVGNTPFRILVAALTPVPEPHLQVLPDVRLPSAPAVLPRTGDGFPWAGPIALLAGLVLLAAGIGLRRAKV